MGINTMKKEMPRKHLQRKHLQRKNRYRMKKWWKSQMSQMRLRLIQMRMRLILLENLKTHWKLMTQHHLKHFLNEVNQRGDQIVGMEILIQKEGGGGEGGGGFRLLAHNQHKVVLFCWAMRRGMSYNSCHV